MKIEIGESLLYSWLRHAKGCQIVQTNWKASTNSWELKNEELLQELMNRSSILFTDKYNCQIYKNTASLSQLLQQAEIDVLGVCFDDNTQSFYVLDVAFHEAGLNYGSKDETVMRVAKKIFRSAMCLNGYFNITNGEIIFASPKIHHAVIDAMMPCIPDIQSLLNEIGLNFQVRIIANDDFNEKIMQPVIAVTAFIADTTELFMRSMQMYNIFGYEKKQQTYSKPKSSNEKVMPDSIEVTNFNGLSEMKIGALVRSVLTKC